LIEEATLYLVKCARKLLPWTLSGIYLMPSWDGPIGWM
jgi:hypothetical protein